MAVDDHIDVEAFDSMTEAATPGAIAKDGKLMKGEGRDVSLHTEGST